MRHGVELKSAEWHRGAVAVLGRMVDECQTVFESDLPHITQGNLEDYIAEYAEQLAAAEAREAGEKQPAPSVRGKKNADYWRGAVELLRQYKRGSIELTHVINQCLEAYEIEKARDAAQPSAAEVIRVAKAALEDIRAAVTTSTGQCGVMGTNWAECDYCGAVSRERMTPIPHEKGCAVSRSTEALATISAWEAGNVQG